MLRVTAVPPAADLVLEEAIPRFLALYPEINVEVSIDASPIDIVAERFDAGIRTGEHLAHDMIAARICREMHFVVVAAPAYLARRGEPRSPQDLAAHDCIRVRLPSGAFVPCRFRIKRRIVEVHAEVRLAVNGGKFAVRAAIEGAGLLQAPFDYVRADLAAGRLVTVLDDWAPPPLEGMFLYYPSRRQIRPALKAFVDFLRVAARDGDHPSTASVKTKAEI